MPLTRTEIGGLRSKIALGDKIFVLDELLKKLTDTYFYDEILLLASNYSELNKRKRTLQISFDEEMLAENKLVMSLLAVLRLVESGLESQKNDLLELSQIEKPNIGGNRITNQPKEKKVRKALENILVVGQIGVGKSSFVNSITQSHVSLIGEYVPTSLGIIPIEYMRGNNKLNIIDLPGLSDEMADQEEYGYLKNSLLNKIKVIDIVVYIIHSDTSRITASEKDSFRFITETLGVDSWGNSIFVLSRADFLMKEGMINFFYSMNNTISLVKKEISKFCTIEDLVRMPFIPMYNQNQNNQKEKDWTVLFWQEVDKITGNR